MPYTEKITSLNPTALLFLLDQSGSMKGDFGGGPGTRICDGAANAINRVIREFVLDCTRKDGVRDYFHMGVIGYADKAAPAFKGALEGLDLVPISQVAYNPLRVEERAELQKVDDGAGGLIDQPVKITFPVWFDPQAEGDIAMCHALDYAYLLIKYWVDSHSECFPPIVINISGGEPTDGNPTRPAEKLRSLTTADGNVLLFNFCLSSRAKGEILFAHDSKGLPDRHAKLLFNISSNVPVEMHSFLRDLYGFQISPNAKCFACNANLENLKILISFR